MSTLEYFILALLHAWSGVYITQFSENLAPAHAITNPRWTTTNLMYNTQLGLGNQKKSGIDEAMPPEMLVENDEQAAQQIPTQDQGELEVQFISTLYAWLLLFLLLFLFFETIEA
jgi:hypothetical protein